MRLIAQRPLKGEYGLVATGVEFECRDEIAANLLSAGLAIRPSYEVKIVIPEFSEVRPVEGAPFRNVPVHNEESTAVATESDSLLSSADVPEPRVIDRRKRAGRSASGSKR